MSNLAARSATQSFIGPDAERGFALAGSLACPLARCFCTVGTELWVAEKDGALSIRDLAKLPEDDHAVGRLYPPDLARANCLLPVGNTVWACCCDGRLRIYDVDRRELTHCLPVSLFGEHEAELVCMLRNGSSVFVGSADGRIYQWDVGLLSLQRVLTGHPAGVKALACCDPLLFSGDGTGVVYVWDAHTARKLSETVVPHQVAVAAIVKVGPYLWCGCTSGQILVYDTSNYVRLQHLQTLSGHRTGLRCLLGLPSRVLSGALDRTICIWDAQTFRLITRMTGHDGFIIGLSACSKTESWRVVSLSNDKTMKAWDVMCTPEVVGIDNRTRNEMLQGMCEAALGDVAWLQQKLQETSNFRLQREEEIARLEQQLKTQAEEAAEDKRVLTAQYEALMEQHTSLQLAHNQLTAALDLERGHRKKIEVECSGLRQALECSHKEQHDADVEKGSLQALLTSSVDRLTAKDRSLADLQAMVSKLQQESVAKTAQIDELLRSRQETISECETLLEARQGQIATLTEQLAEYHAQLHPNGAEFMRNHEFLRDSGATARPSTHDQQGATRVASPPPLEEVGLFGVKIARSSDDNPISHRSILTDGRYASAVVSGRHSPTRGHVTAGVQTSGLVDASVQAVRARKKKKKKARKAVVADSTPSYMRSIDRTRQRAHRAVIEARNAAPP